MKEEDVRIGMKVVPHDKTVRGCSDLKHCLAWGEAKYANQPFLYVKKKHKDYAVLSNDIKGGHIAAYNFTDFEPYIDIELTAEQLSKAIDNLKETVAEYFKPIFEGLIAFVAKNKDTIEKLVEESKEEKLEKEIREAFEGYIKNGCSWSLQTCFRAGFLAGRESK